MCGIAGIVSTDKVSVTKDRIASAINTLAHRGRDDQGFFINEGRNAALGHCRLSIIDLTSEASQPMRYLNRYRIVHNGEVYNYIEIKKELEKKGYNFHTQSDTEVMAAAYDAYGAGCLEKFDGMFAFAIWDENKNILFAARDRFGEKPFFFFFDDEQFLFASEIKALWKMGVNKDVNLKMLYNFLSIGYTTNPFEPKETFFENIYKLPGASFLTYTPNTNELEIEKYWQAEVNIDNTISEQLAIEKFGFLFSQSIKNRLRSDVAIGTSLSGGLDSSAIIAYCSRFSSDQYSHKCFTASFSGFEKDELQYAKLVASAFHLEHYIVEIKDNSVVDLMEEIMHHQEQPVVSASALAQYEVYKEVKKAGVTVLLDGQGADEILAGYHKYYKW
ncbi:MAG: asparagine synthase (glutamine-hydrolyzing), partial [Chitinophagaceae bacterium]